MGGHRTPPTPSPLPFRARRHRLVDSIEEFRGGAARLVRASRGFDFEPAINGPSERAEICWIGTNDQVVAAKCSLDDCAIDDVGPRCLSGQFSNATSLIFVERLNVAAN
jgi:hypothetical protein